MAEQHDTTGLERLAGRLKDRDAQKIEGFVADLRRLTRTARSGTAADVLRVLRDDVGLDQAMEMLEGSRRRLDRSAQTDDLDSLVALARLHPGLEGFEAWLRDSLRDHGTPEGVTLATIHSMKGREWPHVLVHDVSAGVIPHRLADDVEEERRIFHVALTRCSSSVTVVASGSPSPFIEELSTERSASAAPAAPAPPSPVLRPRVGRDRTPTGRPADQRAVNALRQWRAERARAEKKPAYVFLTDATIDQIASALPASLVALGRIKGIGPGKLGAYGDEILALLEQVRDAS
jgi:DNA helicase-2/ATP-dependent DNA helicase PcrA